MDNTNIEIARWEETRGSNERVNLSLWRESNDTYHLEGRTESLRNRRSISQRFVAADDAEAIHRVVSTVEAFRDNRLVRVDALSGYGTCSICGRRSGTNPDCGGCADLRKLAERGPARSIVQALRDGLVASPPTGLSQQDVVRFFASHQAALEESVHELLTATPKQAPPKLADLQPNQIVELVNQPTVFGRCLNGALGRIESVMRPSGLETALFVDVYRLHKRTKRPLKVKRMLLAERDVRVVEPSPDQAAVLALFEPARRDQSVTLAAKRADRAAWEARLLGSPLAESPLTVIQRRLVQHPPPGIRPGEVDEFFKRYKASLPALASEREIGELDELIESAYAFYILIQSAGVGLLKIIVMPDVDGLHLSRFPDGIPTKEPITTAIELAAHLAEQYPGSKLVLARTIEADT